MATPEFTASENQMLDELMNKDDIAAVQAVVDDFEIPPSPDVEEEESQTRYDPYNLHRQPVERGHRDFDLMPSRAAAAAIEAEITAEPLPDWKSAERTEKVDALMAFNRSDELTGEEVDAMLGGESHVARLAAVRRRSDSPPPFVPPQPIAHVHVCVAAVWSAKFGVYNHLRERVDVPFDAAWRALNLKIGDVLQAIYDPTTTQTRVLPRRVPHGAPYRHANSLVLRAQATLAGLQQQVARAEAYVQTYEAQRLREAQIEWNELRSKRW